MKNTLVFPQKLSLNKISSIIFPNAFGKAYELKRDTLYQDTKSKFPYDIMSVSSLNMMTLSSYSQDSITGEYGFENKTSKKLRDYDFVIIGYPWFEKKLEYKTTEEKKLHSQEKFDLGFKHKVSQSPFLFLQ